MPWAFAPARHPMAMRIAPRIARFFIRTSRFRSLPKIRPRDGGFRLKPEATCEISRFFTRLVAGPTEGAVVLRRVHSLHCLPGANGGRHPRSGIRGHEIAEEVNVPVHRRPPVRRFGAIEAHVLPHEIAICDARPTRQLSFAPAIEPISGAGSTLERWVQPPSFPLEERLGVTIVRVEDHAPIEPEPTV